jgi:UPF0755 protein
MRRFVIIGFLLIVLTGVSAVIMFYNRILRNNIELESGEEYYLFIPTGSEFEDVYRILKEEKLLRDTASFRWIALKKNYPRHVYPGRYRIKAGMNNNRLVGLLRSGEQVPVQLIFNNVRSRETLAGLLSSQIEADSLEILSLFYDDGLLHQHGFQRETALGVFIPNTYEIYWNTSGEDLFNRMVREYRIFWNERRLSLARKIGLEPMEVITLASIVDEETLFEDEEARIAGVYINRLKRGIRLQADPTVKYAAGDMSMNRVLKKHLAIDSPYNTYRYGGVPPGPIVIPSISAIDAVLNYERHNFLYFCAREDFSGYHNFATTLAQHNKNARSYQNALNRRKIFN